MIDTDVLNYCPIQKNIPQMSIGLKKLPYYPEPNKNKIFQIDEHFKLYHQAKVEGRRERLSKYYQNQNVHYPRLISWMIQKLVQETPEYFSFQDRKLTCQHTNEVLTFNEDYTLDFEHTSSENAYQDAFDALSMQVQDDLVVMKFFEDKTNAAQIISLFVPNDWSAEIAIGQSFEFIHNPVPNIDKIIRKPSAMIQGLVSKSESYERVGAMSMRTRFELNEHPDFFKNNPQSPFNSQDPKLAVRFERQTVSGFPEDKIFLFTIRTYFKNLHTIDKNSEEWPGIKESLAIDYSEQDINKHAKAFLVKNREEVLKWLEA